MMTVADYVERVRAALGDLPPRTRDELLEDLPEHLAEVAASGDEPLESLVGPPEVYAAELRAAAAVETPRRPDVVRQVRDRLRAADTRFGPLIGYASASDFGRQLRPAWWVARGYLAAMVIAILLTRGTEVGGLVPRLGGSTFVGVALVAAFVIGSIRLGRRQDRLSTVPRIAIGAVTAVLAVVAVAGFYAADDRWQMAGYWPQTVSYNQFSHVQDVYVYDKDGRPLRDITLTDQNGVPIRIGTENSIENRIELCGPADPALYPHCPNLTPSLQPLPRIQIIIPSPTPLPSATG